MADDAQAAGAQPNPDAASADVTDVTDNNDTPPKEGEQADAQSGEQKAAEDAKVAQDVVYEFTLPEGMTLDEETGNDLKALAKENKLSKEQAQKLLDVGVKQRMKEAEAFQKQRETWREDIRTDADIGGDKLEVNLALAKKAVETFGTPGAQALFDGSWVGDHPDIVKTFVAIGKAISEDRIVTSGGQAETSTPSLAQRMYPNMNP